MRLATASRLDLWFRVTIERNSLYGWPKQRSPRRTNDQTAPNAYFSIREMDPCWYCLVQARLSGHRVQVTTSRQAATSVPRPVQLASSESGMETNRGCAGEVILQPLNGVLLGTAITSEESISPPTPT